jgi:hypothetical protein
MTGCVAVPKAPVNKNQFMPLPKNQIRLSRQIPGMKSIAIAEREDYAPYK